MPRLVLSLHAASPFTPPSWHALTGLGLVELGRGSERSAKRSRSGLVVTVPDRAMSSDHARLNKQDRHWVLEDRGAKNGCYVNGVGVKEQRLRDGDVIELGQSFFVFRDRGPLPGDALDGDFAHETRPGLRTLQAEMARDLDAILRVAPSRVVILILGESGTGKEVTARAIHEASGRRGALVAVNCGALSPTLLDAQLFGHRKGAFSGATDDRLGLVRGADGGTLFLDEIGDLPVESQTALLRVLQEGEVVPVGDSKPVAVDVRVIAATHRNLEQLVERGEFRHDLWARLQGVTIELAPLRDRREDMGVLVAALAQGWGSEGAPGLRLGHGVGRALFGYDWPLNVRELERVLAAAWALSEDGEIQLEHLPERVRCSGGNVEAASVPKGQRAMAPAPSRSDRDRRAQLHELLERERGNVSAAARVLKTSRAQIHRWIKRYGLDIDSYR